MSDLKIPDNVNVGRGGSGRTEREGGDDVYFPAHHAHDLESLEGRREGGRERGGGVISTHAVVIDASDGATRDARRGGA